MTTELETTTEHPRTATSELVIQPGQSHFTPAQEAAVRALGAEDAPPGDVALLFHQSVRMGLDPFAKQIYLIGRDERRQVNGQWQTVGKKYTIQTGIDGFRVIRDRPHADGSAYDGMDVEWCGPDGQWRDVWTESAAPTAARVRIYVKGRSRPESAIAYFSEYAQTDRNGNPLAMWKSRPAGQLAKCAEALGLRRAFPQDLSGVYVDEEMQQADNVRDVTPRPSGFDAAEWVARIDAAGTDVDALRRVYIEANPRHANVLGETLPDGSRVADAITERVAAAVAAAAQEAAGEPEEAPRPPRREPEPPAPARAPSAAATDADAPPWDIPAGIDPDELV